MEMDTCVAWPTELTDQYSPSREDERFTTHPITNCSFRTGGRSEGTHISSLTGTATRETREGEGHDLMVEECGFEHDTFHMWDDAFGNTENVFGLKVEESIDMNTENAMKTKKCTDYASEGSADGLISVTREIIDLEEGVIMVRVCNVGADIVAMHEMNLPCFLINNKG